ncbi:MAG: electron transfer flavoprotein subunit alpha/FixB family protein [Flavobacteriales bacterium]|nr:electron transfer flavoprotein subunit alpha/FixB family protein [Flavobacteriales bacterium]
MSIVIYAESHKGAFKKVAFELASYAKQLGSTTGDSVVAVSFGEANAEELGKYGVEKVYQIAGKEFNAKKYANAIAEVVKKEGASIVLLPSTTDAKYLSGLLTVGVGGAFVSNVVELPVSTSPFQVKRTSFSSKAFSIVQLDAAIKVLMLAKNSFGIKESNVAVSVEAFSPSAVTSSLEVVSAEEVTGKVTIADAEIVVSGGRGLKGPENWGMIEELAKVLNAATACSKPVSDLGWRPHGEHVGQTGKPVASNLYIAIGISGAIQHIAGINSSKVKVVINTDPEAPFFKVADYGVVGDAFEVVPQLIEKLKAFKANNN